MADTRQGPPFDHDPTVDYEHQVEQLLEHLERQALAVHELEKENAELRAIAGPPNLDLRRGATIVLATATGLLTLGAAATVSPPIAGLILAAAGAIVYRSGWPDRGKTT